MQRIQGQVMQLPVSKNPELEIRVLEIAVIKKNETYIHDRSTFVRLEDEGAGEFLKVYQTSDYLKSGEVYFNVDEWEDVKIAVDFMASIARPDYKN